MVKEKLRQAAAFCQSEGAHSVKDIRDFKLVDEFLEALEPLRRIPKAKLEDALKPDKRRQSTKNRRFTTTVLDAAMELRHYTSTDKMRGDGILVRGRAYKLIEKLSEGNAEIWKVTSDRDEHRVLKFSDVEAIRAEVAAHMALAGTNPKPNPKPNPNPKPKPNPNPSPNLSPNQGALLRGALRAWRQGGSARRRFRTASRALA